MYIVKYIAKFKCYRLTPMRRWQDRGALQKRIPIASGLRFSIGLRSPLKVQDFIVVFRPGLFLLVIFANPNNCHINWLKRIVALPGDTVEIQNNVLIVNGMPLEQRPVADQEIAEIEDQINGTVVEEVNGDASYRIMLSAKSGKHFGKIRVPNGHWFVLGDNRGNSVDSRHVGPVPLRDVMGCVDFIYLPAETWSRFGVFEGE